MLQLLSVTDEDIFRQNYCGMAHLQNVYPSEQLGPPNKRDNTIPMTVKTDNGQFSNDIQTVLNKWRNDYKTLFSTKYEAGSVDEELLKTAERTILDLNDDTQEHQWHEGSFDLNRDISDYELSRVLRESKNGKACGMDDIAYKIYKSGNLTHCLVTLFNKCFASGMIPSEWNKINIKPIPKKGKDSRDPLNTRGLNMMLTIAKLYTGILKNRLYNYIENEGLLHEEQGAYRKQRSCVDH
eukprot:GHVU01206295.1.p1 GENE.GHVU01206295.1~~GHVU01206295.1.p1  ORF type:complete len:239 (+),score=23.63 GHVU01206295.1:1044-1760(+)